MNNDLIDAIKARDVWIFLAWQDIKVRYRNSKIGPFWITLSMLIFCVALSAIYVNLLKVDIKQYLPFFATGYVFWAMVSGMINEAPNIFVENGNYIKDIKMNLLTIYFRFVMKHIIILGHNAIIILGTYLIFHTLPGFVIFLFIPGFILVLLNLISIGVVLSFIGVYFRDFTQIVQSVVQIMFFITPITWYPRLLQHHTIIVKLNPLTHYFDLIRSPLIGETPELISWIFSLCTLICFGTIAYILYTRKKYRIPFWA